MNKNNEKKEVSLIMNIINKCKYSLDGIKYCLKNESSFLLEAICCCILIILGILFDITFMEWVVAFGTLALIGVIELINTAIEAVCDLITLDYRENIKIAKDCASAATGIMTFLAIIANLIIFVPYFIKLFL